MPCASAARRRRLPRHRGLHVLAFTKTAAFRHDSIPAAAPRVAGARHRERDRRGCDRGRLPCSPTRDSHATTRWSSCCTTGDVLDDAQQGASSATCAAAAGMPASTRPPTRSTAGRGTASSSARTSAVTPPSSAPRSTCSRARPSTVRLPRRWVRTDEWYSFGVLADRPRPRPRTARRELATIRWKRDGRRPPDRLVAPGGQGRASVHGWRAYLGGVCRAALPGAPARRGSSSRRGLRGTEVRLGRRSRSAAGVVTADVRATGCLRCTGRVRVRVAGRWRATPLRATSGGLRATTGVRFPAVVRLEVAARGPRDRADCDDGSNVTVR